MIKNNPMIFLQYQIKKTWTHVRIIFFLRLQFCISINAVQYSTEQQYSKVQYDDEDDASLPVVDGIVC